MLKNTSNKLTDAQLALLQLFNVELNESDMLELKSLLVNFLNKKLQREIDDVFEQKKYSQNQFEQWLNDPET